MDTLENVERRHFVLSSGLRQIGLCATPRPLPRRGRGEGWIIGFNCAHGNRQTGQISGRETFRDSTDLAGGLDWRDSRHARPEHTSAN